MESIFSNLYFEKYVDARMQSTEELIKQTRTKLSTKMPKFWKLRQMKEYCRCIKEAKEKINHLQWSVKEMECFYLENMN